MHLSSAQMWWPGWLKRIRARWNLGNTRLTCNVYWAEAVAPLGRCVSQFYHRGAPILRNITLAAYSSSSQHIPIAITVTPLSSSHAGTCQAGQCRVVEEHSGAGRAPLPRRAACRRGMVQYWHARTHACLHALIGQQASKGCSGGGGECAREGA
jgi:hypothetical protein